MEEAKTMKTPMSSSIKLDKVEKGKSIDSTMYRGMIGSLLYLTASRPDIMVTYGMGGPIISTVRGVEIRLDSESICRIFDIPLVGLRVYESKMWSTVPGFEPRKAIQRICGLLNDQGMGKPSAHSLTVISRVLHHMLCSIFLPRGEQ
ncbi:hypothetical protein AAG906_039113 [Vitis piasezkii]